MPKSVTPKINYTSLAKALNKSAGTKRKQNWTDRNYPVDKYYRVYLPRTEQSLAKYGPSYYKATDTQRAARQADRMIGRGKFSFAGGPSLRQLRSASRWAGGVVEGFNPQAGMALRAAGSRTGRGLYMGGHGSYTVGNSLIEGAGGGPVPTFETVADETGALIVTHSEFVSDVYGNPFGVNFKNTSYSINPGLARTFPFLSQIAANFEEYEMVQLCFTFVSKLSDNISSSDGQVGSILMYTDYNPADNEKTSKQQMLQSYGVSNGRVVDNIMHGVECDPTKLKGDGHKFIRVRQTEADLNDFDAGLFQLAVHGTPNSESTSEGEVEGALANEVLGELHVSYKCLLRKSRVYSLYGLTQQKDMICMQSDESDMSGENIITYASNNGIGCKLEATDIDYQIKITFPASFAGPVKVTVYKELVDGNHTLNQIPTRNLTQTGNVDTQDWLPIGFEGGDEMKWSVTRVSPADETAKDSKCTTIEVTMQVEQAESGTENTIALRTPYSSDAGQHADTIVTIERFNNFEIYSGGPKFA